MLLEGETLLAPSPISMTLGDGRVLGAEPEVKGAERRSENTVLRPVVRVKNEEVRDHFNEVTLNLGEFDLVVRTYDAARPTVSAPGSTAR